MRRLLACSFVPMVCRCPDLCLTFLFAGRSGCWSGNVNVAGCAKRNVKLDRSLQTSHNTTNSMNRVRITFCGSFPTIAPTKTRRDQTVDASPKDESFVGRFFRSLGISSGWHLCWHLDGGDVSTHLSALERKALANTTEEHSQIKQLATS